MAETRQANNGAGHNAPPRDSTESVHLLIDAVAELSQARELDVLTAIVSSYARILTGADGATLVLRDGDRCYYVDEDSIGPLWKGKKFPMSACISGWTMLHAQVAAIEDIYQDSRIPVEAYKPTFVKSLVMVPIRPKSPMGAIGNYWASQHQATPLEIKLLQALADATSVALENTYLYAELQKRIQALEQSNYELSRYSWVASHDMREPLRTVTTNLQMIEEDSKGRLTKQCNAYLHQAIAASRRSQKLVRDIFSHTQVAEAPIQFATVNVNTVLNEVLKNSKPQIGSAHIVLPNEIFPTVWGNADLISQVFVHLLSNALKFSNPERPLKIEFAFEERQGEWMFAVTDNGIGIDSEFMGKVFQMFYRVFPHGDYEGSGLGLALCKKIVEQLGGKIWIESDLHRGTTVYFTLPATVPGTRTFDGELRG